MAAEKNAFALITLAAETARHTRQNDLDIDEQLAKVDKWGKEGIEAAKVAPKLRADVSDADWDGYRKDLEAQGMVALGMADALRKNYDGAAANYRLSLSTGPTPNAATYIRLAQVYMAQGKLGDADFTLDKAIAIPNVPAQIKSVAESMKAEIAKHKPAAPAAAPGGSTAPANPAPPASSAPPAPHH
jgi:tetratricopeptide (TPR) repeat protein